MPAEISTPRREPIRVCHIDSGDLWAGAEVNTTTLLKALTGRPDLRLSAILLNEGEMSRRLRSYGIEVKVIPESEHGFLGIFNEAARFLRSHPVRILHSHRYKENLLAAALARRCGIPHLVCTRHGAPEPFRGWSGVRHGAMALLDRLIARHFTDRVISPSEELRTRLLRQLPPGKVVTIPTGIDIELVSSSLTKAEAKHSLGLSEEARVVGYAGRLVPIKRLDVFLRAAERMAQADSDVVFVIAGGGPEEKHLRALASDLNLGGRVRFLGFRDAIYDVMRAFDVFLLCSDHEGLPRCILEALQLGVPVVARPVGGIPEVIEDGVNGILTAGPSDLALACLRLLADEDLQGRIAKGGSWHVGTKLGSGYTAEQMAALYQGLVGMDTR